MIFKKITITDCCNCSHWQKTRITVPCDSCLKRIFDKEGKISRVETLKWQPKQMQ